MKNAATRKRRGLSLLEVIVALAIFLFSLVALGQLINFGSDRALDASYLQDATFKCQSKLAEFACGGLALGSQQESPFEEDPDWLWSANCTEVTEIPGLWRVEITVFREKAFGNQISVTVSQMIMDPASRGSTFDPTPKAPETEEPTEEGTTTTPSGG